MYVVLVQPTASTNFEWIFVINEVRMNVLQFYEAYCECIGCKVFD